MRGGVSPPLLSLSAVVTAVFVPAVDYHSNSAYQEGAISQHSTVCLHQPTMTSVANERPDVVTPALMTIPAILQNPKSKTQAQVESYAAQQREKAQAQARRHLEEKHGDRSSGVDRRKGEGKRSLRRRENGEH